MPRKKLPRALKKCEREGCENTFVVTIGAQYVPKYCCSRCAALATVDQRKKRSARNPKYGDPVAIPRTRSITLEQLQNFPINYDDLTGGKFARLVEGILSGNLQLIGY
jgi:hypothetical protein